MLGYKLDVLVRHKEHANGVLLTLLELLRGIPEDGSITNTRLTSFVRLTPNAPARTSLDGKAVGRPAFGGTIQRHDSSLKSPRRQVQRFQPFSKHFKLFKGNEKLFGSQPGLSRSPITLTPLTTGILSGPLIQGS
jgi:hypothetical protein